MCRQCSQSFRACISYINLHEYITPGPLRILTRLLLCYIAAEGLRRWLMAASTSMVSAGLVVSGTREYLDRARGRKFETHAALVL